MEQFLLDVVTQVVAGILVGLIIHRWIKRVCHPEVGLRVAIKP